MYAVKVTNDQLLTNYDYQIIMVSHRTISYTEYAYVQMLSLDRMQLIIEILLFYIKTVPLLQ